MEEDEFFRHKVWWEFSRGSAIMKNGYQVPNGPICPIEKADLIPVEVIESTYDLIWRDNVAGEQVFRCPDCNEIYHFPFETLGDLHRDVYSSYLGALRRGEIKKQEEKNQLHFKKVSYAKKETMTQNITKQFLGPISQLTQATKHRDTIQNNKYRRNKTSLLDWIKQHIVVTLIVGILVGLIVSYLTNLLGWK